MSDDWYREQSRQDQMRQDQQFRDQLIHDQFLDDQRIAAQHDEHRIMAEHEERRREFEDETSQRRQSELNQLIEEIQPAPRGAHTGWSRPTVGGAGRTEQFTWGKLLAAGIVAGAMYLASRYEQQARRGPDSPL